MLGRDETKHTICEYEDNVSACPKSCSKCAIGLKTDGDMALSGNDVQSAIKYYKKALFIDSRFAEAWNNLGNAYGLLNEHNKALAAFEKALAIDDTYGRALFGKAISLKYLGKLEESMSVVNTILEMYDDENVKNFKESLKNMGIAEDTKVYSLNHIIDLMTEKVKDIINEYNLYNSDGRLVVERELGNKQPYSSKIHDYFHALNKYNGLEKECYDSIIASFFGGICLTFYFYEDKQTFVSQDPYDYISDHANLEELDNTAYSLLLNFDDSKEEKLWTSIYNYANYCYGVIKCLQTKEDVNDAIVDACESAYVTGVLFGMKNRNSSVANYEDFEIEGDKLISYKGTAENIVIPNGIRIIGKEAFESQYDIESIVVPEGVQIIERKAFSSCFSLQSISLPKSLTVIGERAFDGCRFLKRIPLSESVAEIGDHAFSYCRELEYINIPSNIKRIGNCAFYYCESLTSITINSTCVELGDGLFRFCKNLENVIIKRDMKTIPDGMFWSCEKLRNYDIPYGVTRIGNEAFCFCKSLKEIVIPKTVNCIEKGAFRGCSGIKTLYVESENCKIESGAFNSCVNLERITINSPKELVDDNAFTDCGNNVSINICGERINPLDFIDYTRFATDRECGATVKLHCDGSAEFDYTRVNYKWIAHFKWDFDIDNCDIDYYNSLFDNPNGKFLLLKTKPILQECQEYIYGDTLENLAEWGKDNINWDNEYLIKSIDWNKFVKALSIVFLNDSPYFNNTYWKQISIILKQFKRNPSLLSAVLKRNGLYLIRPSIFFDCISEAFSNKILNNLNEDYCGVALEDLFRFKQFIEPSDLEKVEEQCITCFRKIALSRAEKFITRKYSYQELLKYDVDEFFFYSTLYDSFGDQSDIKQRVNEYLKDFFYTKALLFGASKEVKNAEAVKRDIFLKAMYYIDDEGIKAYFHKLLDE